MKSFEDMQKLGKDNAEATMKTLSAFSKSVQAITAELTDYSKKAFQDGAAATEKLMGAKSLEKAVEVQSDYLKTAYEGFVSQTAKLGQLYSDLAQETYKPFESYVSKASGANAMAAQPIKAARRSATMVKLAPSIYTGTNNIKPLARPPRNPIFLVSVAMPVSRARSAAALRRGSVAKSFPRITPAMLDGSA